VRLLLDACTFLWIAAGSTELSKRAAQLFSDPPTKFFSARPPHGKSRSNIPWGGCLCRLPLPITSSACATTTEIAPLPIREEDALYLPRMPKLHRDPFDRMLVCQAIVNSLTLLTPDPLIS
jgi:PIN domain nuclease of toxin-antitoxin system